MPLILPKQRAATREANYSARPISTWGTSLTSDGVAHTLPAAYTDLIATTTYDSDWVNITFHTNTTVNTDSDSLVTIYVGAAAAEQVLIPTLLAGWVSAPDSSAPFVKRYSFPLHVPAGSRISARHQSVRTATAVYCMIELLGGGRSDHWTGTGVECVGANATTSGGVFVTPGTTGEGTLTSIGTNTYEWGYAMPMIGGNTDTSLVAGLESADIGTASAIIPGLDDFLFHTSTNEVAGTFSTQLGRFATVPASTELYLSTWFSSSTVEAKDYCIYGVF